MPSRAQVSVFDPSPSAHPAKLLTGHDALYETDFGAAYVADSLELLKSLPEGSV